MIGTLPPVVPAKTAAPWRDRDGMMSRQAVTPASVGMDRCSQGRFSTPGLQPITNREFRQLRDLVYDRFGINLTEQKRFLLVSRLQKMLRAAGFSRFKELYEVLVREESVETLSELINRLATNYSYFYRGRSHFEFFRDTVLPEVAARRQQRRVRDLRVWTAGCSTGEEPYMLVMLMLEFFGRDYDHWDAGLLATDISAKALNAAAAAVYPRERVKDVPPHLRRAYFTELENGQVAVREQVKQEVTFRRFNLMNRTFPFKKAFDVIFCRNVMIYFDTATRQALLRKFHALLEPGGYFFVGHSETLGRDQDMFQYIMPAVYRCR